MVKIFKHTITREDLEMNPSLVGEFQVGDIVELPIEEDDVPEDADNLEETEEGTE